MMDETETFADERSLQMLTLRISLQAAMEAFVGAEASRKLPSPASLRTRGEIHLGELAAGPFHRT
jgi:hypothetical protein